MATIMSTGQITIVDLTDQRTSSFYLQADRSKIQTYNVNTKVYSPNYINEQITITPAFFFGNEDYSTKIEKGDIFYYINGSSDYAAKYDPDATPSGDYYQKGVNLIIAQNIGEGTLADDVLRIRAVIVKDAITDQATSLGNAEISAVIEFAKVISGADGSAGISVTNIEQQYILSSSSTSAPAQNDSGWSSNNPAWVENQYLWIRTKIGYSNGNEEYTEPYCDSSWKVAADGVSTLTERLDNADRLIEALQNEVDSVIETWYLPGSPTADGFVNPWEDADEYHVGDLYYDTESGYSYRFLVDESGNYSWTQLSDNELSAALQQIKTLQTTVDGKVTVYYGEKPTTANVDDMWVDSDGNFHQYIEISTGVYEWSLASYSIDYVEIEYATSSSNTIAPTEGWNPTSPTWNADTYVWQRTVTYYKGGVIDKDISDPVCISAAAARSITISGEQVFKSTDGSTYTPTTITLTAVTVGGLTAGKWYYKNGTNWVDTGKTGNSFAITSGHAAFGTGTTATIKVVATESDKYYDIISLYKVTDGQNGDDGAPASSIFLTNENITFAGDVDGQVAATSIKCNVVAYTGTEKITPTVGTISGAVTGMSVTKGTAVDREIPITITITDKATLGGASAQSGTLTVPITSPVSTTLYITWSKVNTGATGAAGANGADAIFAIVESTSGKVVFTDTDNGDITLKASLYIGGAVQTSDVIYSWTSIPTGVTGTSQTLAVSRDKVPSARSFVCAITYKEKTYTDSIALSDKTDAVYCVVESSKGDKFTNGNVSTVLTCRVFDGYGEVDEAGTKYTYTWEKYVNGVSVNFDTSKDASAEDAVKQKTGKQLTVTSNYVDAKAVFACTITV